MALAKTRTTTVRTDGGRDDVSDVSATDESLRAAMKKQLRARMQSVRKATPADARQRRSERLCERLRTLTETWRPRVLASFMPMTREPQILAATDAMLAERVQVALPRVDAESGLLELREWTSGDERDLLRHPLGFLEPRPDAPTVDPRTVEVVWVPALAADPRGYRIGYGKGYYDRLLPTLANAVRIAVVYDFEVLAELPNTPLDAHVDWIVTDLRTLRTSRRAGGLDDASSGLRNPTPP